MTSQLESQRRYFEEKMLALEQECSDKLLKSEEQFNSLVTTNSLENQDIQSLIKVKEQTEKKSEQVIYLYWYTGGFSLSPAPPLFVSSYVASC